MTFGQYIRADPLGVAGEEVLTAAHAISYNILCTVLSKLGRYIKYTLHCHSH